jgi:hypothetical protein
MAKKVDPVAAKAAKQKKLAIVGGVLLLAVLAFQVPRTMKMLNGGGNVTTPASTVAASTTATTGTSLAPPTLDGGSTSSDGSDATTGSPGQTSADGVSDPSAPLPPSSGQLISFNQFKSKDPFKQQIQDCAGGACGTASPPAGGTASSPSSGAGTTAPAPAKPASAPTAAAFAKPTMATISVNGVREKVAGRGTFPSASPVFVLVRLTRTEAMIGIAGGSLEGGAHTVGVKVGTTVKLQNTADQSTYVVKLISVS